MKEPLLSFGGEKGGGGGHCARAAMMQQALSKVMNEIVNQRDLGCEQAPVAACI